MLNIDNIDYTGHINIVVNSINQKIKKNYQNNYRQDNDNNYLPLPLSSSSSSLPCRYHYLKKKNETLNSNNDHNLMNE